ncbi:MAG: NAD-dependent epimerase/dehydratase family protein [Planctomycetaceae bacterium]
MLTHNLPFRTPTLLVGCGYLGQRVAAAVARQSPEHTIYATTRSAAKAANLAKRSLVPIVADWTDRRTLARLPECGRVLVAVSYDRQSGRSREESQVGGLSHLLEFVPPTADICYISTTGVYHQSDGSWVDETSPARPRSEGGRVHLRAEELLARRRPAGRWTVLRLAGIYGPGRVPRVADVLAGRPIEGASAGYLNLIHVEDAAQAVLAAWRAEQRHRLYLVADDVPVIRRRFYEQVAQFAHAAPPTFVSPAAGAAAAFLSARSESNKRIWNRRFRHDLMPRLAYRDYIDGLSALELGTASSKLQGVVARDNST